MDDLCNWYYYTGYETVHCELEYGHGGPLHKGTVEGRLNLSPEDFWFDEGDSNADLTIREYESDWYDSCEIDQETGECKDNDD